MPKPTRRSVVGALGGVVVGSAGTRAHQQDPAGRRQSGAADPAPQGRVSWSQTYGGSDDDYAATLVAAPDGGYLIAGGRGRGGEGRATTAWLLKVTLEGNIEWEWTPDRQLGGFADALALNDGYLLTTDGPADTGDGRAAKVVQVSADGETEQIHSYNVDAAGEGNDRAIALAPATGGDFYVAGQTLHDGANIATWLLKVATDGANVWTHPTTFELAAPSTVIRTSDDSALIGGIDVERRHAAWLAKIGADGTIQWSNTYGGEDGDSTTDVVETTTGDFLFGGQKQSGVEGQADAWVASVSRDGRLQWEQTIGGHIRDGASTVAETDAGNYLLGGVNAWGTGGDEDIADRDGLLVNLAPDGTVRWRRTYRADDSDAWESFADIVPLDEGYLTVGQRVVSGAGNQVWLAKLQEVVPTESVDDGRTLDVEAWAADWGALVARLAGVWVVGPVVLWVLVAVSGRLSGDDEGAGEQHES